MPTRKITDGQIEQACELRETTGLSTRQIIARLMLDISPGALDWHFLQRGADRPNARPQRSFYLNSGAVFRRGRHVVRRFTPEEDAIIEAGRLQGKSARAIGRMLDPPRQHNSIQGRLMTLARYAERLSESGAQHSGGTP